MFKKIKRFFCKHDYRFEFKVVGMQENIWKCAKCEQRYMQHFGINAGGKISDSTFEVLVNCQHLIKNI